MGTGQAENGSHLLCAPPRVLTPSEPCQEGLRVEMQPGKDLTSVLQKIQTLYENSLLDMADPHGQKKSKNNLSPQK